MKKLILIIAIASAAFIASSKPACKGAAYSEVADSAYKKMNRPAVAITDTQLAAILGKVRQQTNDNKKLAVLKAALVDKGITVDQLTQLLNQLLTDASKLNAAEYAYPRTVDYKNFLNIEDLFGSESTKEQLEDYLKKNK